MHIGFICNEYPPGPHGGIGAMTQVLARALVKAGHQVRVFGTYSAAYPAPDYETDQGVQVQRLRIPASRLGWVQARYQLLQTIKRDTELDVIEVPDWEGWAAGWPRLSAPVIVRLNGSQVYFAAELQQTVKRSARWLEGASLRRADYWCSVSRYTAEQTKKLFNLRSGPHAILYNPVDLPADENNVARVANRVMFTGTLTAKKGIISLLAAWPAVLERRPDAKLHIYGKDGCVAGGRSMQAFLLAQHDERVRASLHFHGHVGREHLLQALRTARLAVFPSYAEAFALAPLEAMACGCPTIYSTRGSGPELIAHERDGLLVEPDKPAEIAAALIRLLADDELAQRLGAAGRARIRQGFSVPALVAQNEAFYQACLNDFRGEPGYAVLPACGLGRRTPSYR